VLDGRVERVDARRGRIDLRSGYGRIESVRYHDETRVSYRRQAYHPSALERGDLVRVWVQVDRGGTPWADRVEVRESIRDRVVFRDRVERLDGRVGSLQPRRGTFTLERGGYRPLLIVVPQRLDRAELRHLERLRPGDRVRLDVRPLSSSEAELVRFR
jgi:hypothetical protein